MRTFDDVTLDLRAGVTVLIGENGSGKSTVLECLEILRRTATPGFFDDLHRIHGGLLALLRRGAPRMELEARFEHPTLPSFTYRIALMAVGGFTQIAEEALHLDTLDAPQDLFVRTRRGLRAATAGLSRMVSVKVAAAEATILSGSTPLNEEDDPLALAFRLPDEVSHARAVIAAIDVQLPFDVAADWASRAVGRTVPTRTSATLRRTDRLERFGANLANAWASLRSEYGEAHWQRHHGARTTRPR